jgi:crotonobetainyl-CoA:carnitine CoA-transferase CaiB-like acyl-CoA transferase
MPRRSSGPRLYWDKSRGTWLIIDGSFNRRTGCGAADIKQAERALRDYIEGKHKPAATETPLIADVLAAYADEHIKQSHISKMVKDKNGKEKGFITLPTVLSRTPADVVTTAPQWGEHTAEVLAEVGYSPEEIAKFYEQGVL